MMALKYKLKNLLLHTPFRYGIYAKHSQIRDPGYDLARDRHPVREKHHGEGGWSGESNGQFTYRDYRDYDEYRLHQVQKFNEILKHSGGFDNRVILEYRKRFYQRFRHLREYLPNTAIIICAGARQGTEVEVLRDLGFSNAIGIDLNPGPDNPLVRLGDFMSFAEANDSVDLLYTNCVDHAFDLQKFFAEHYRILKHGGYALYDLAGQEAAGAFEAVDWPSQESVIKLMLQQFEKLIHVETDGERGWKWILLQKAPA